MEKIFIISGKEVKVYDFKCEGSEVSFKLRDKNYSFSLVKKDGSELIIQGENRFKAAVGSPTREGDQMVMAHGRETIGSAAGKKMKKSGGPAGGLTSPMPGKIFKIVKEVGSEVKKGEAILILEAMKMEHSIRSDKDGKVKKISHKVGDLVQGGVVLAEVE